MLYEHASSLTTRTCQVMSIDNTNWEVQICAGYLIFMTSNTIGSKLCFLIFRHLTGPGLKTIGLTNNEGIWQSCQQITAPQPYNINNVVPYILYQAKEQSRS